MASTVLVVTALEDVIADIGPALASGFRIDGDGQHLLHPQMPGLPLPRP